MKLRSYIPGTLEVRNNGRGKSDGLKPRPSLSFPVIPSFLGYRQALSLTCYRAGRIPIFLSLLFQHLGERNDFDSLLLHPGNHLFDGFDRGRIWVANPDRFPFGEGELNQLLQLLLDHFLRR